MRFLFASASMPSVFSPSSDKNTFLVVNLDETQTFYEFKVSRNDAARNYLNNWVVFETSKRAGRIPTEPFYPKFEIKPTIFKT